MLVIGGVSWDLIRFLQFIFTTLVIAIGLHTLVKKTASKYFEVDANFEGDHHPSSSSNAMEPVCAECASHAVKKCSRCKAVRYCSIKCQQSHWISGHKEKCKDYSGASRPIKKPKDNHLYQLLLFLFFDGTMQFLMVRRFLSSSSSTISPPVHVIIKKIQSMMTKEWRPPPRNSIKSYILLKKSTSIVRHSFLLGV